MEDEKLKPPVQDPPETRLPSAAALPRPAAADPRRTTGGILGMLNNSGALSVVHAAALVFLTFNSIVAAYRARNDPWTVAFIVSAYVALMLFFWCLHAFDKASPAGKRRLKVPIWALALALNLMFACKVSTMLPFGLAVAIWFLAGATTFAGFYAFFIHDNEDTVTGNGLAEGKNMADGNKIQKHLQP